MLSDKLAAIVSDPIATYMNEHNDTNLAFVKHFGGKADAVSATFESLNSSGFLMSCKSSNGFEGKVFIEYTFPVTKRQEVGRILESMANEANKVFPSKVLIKASEINSIQESEISRLQQTKDTNVLFASDESVLGLDEFIPADRFWQVSIALGMGMNAVMGYATDDFLKTIFPSFVLSIHNYLTPETIRTIFKYALVAHLAEGCVALFICLRRNWYSPLNVTRWTISTILYGAASLSKLASHRAKVEKSV